MAITKDTQSENKDLPTINFIAELPDITLLQPEEEKEISSITSSVNLTGNDNNLSPYNQKLNLNRNPTQSVFPLPGGPQMAKNPLEKARNKIAVEPGHSPLDWARLSSSGKDLRGVANIAGITLQELKQHNTEQDAWCALFGKVYNITPYMKFHPGGVKQLMKGAGKDATKLYNKVHPWVNAESLLNKCLVGFLVE